MEAKDLKGLPYKEAKPAINILNSAAEERRVNERKHDEATKAIRLKRNQVTRQLKREETKQKTAHRKHKVKVIAGVLSVTALISGLAYVANKNNDVLQEEPSHRISMAINDNNEIRREITSIKKEIASYLHTTQINNGMIRDISKTGTGYIAQYETIGNDGTTVSTTQVVGLTDKQKEAVDNLEVLKAYVRGETSVKSEDVQQALIYLQELRPVLEQQTQEAKEGKQKREEEEKLARMAKYKEINSTETVSYEEIER